jgi:repressor LexA
MITYGLTFQQRKCLTFLRAYIERNGMSPSYEEIAGAMGVASKGRVFQLINQLEQRGKIARLPGRSRSIVVCEADDPYTADAIAKLPRDRFKSLIAACNEEIARRRSRREARAA